MPPEPRAGSEGAAPASLPRLTALLLVAIASLSLLSCQETAFGMPVARLMELLAGDDPAAILAIPDEKLGSRGDLGPEAYYFLGRWIAEKTGDADRPRRLYRLAWERCEGMTRREAGAALAELLARTGDWSALLSFAAERRAAGEREARTERLDLEARAALGQGEELAAAVEAFREAFPAEAAEDSAALACLAGQAGRRAGRPGWSVQLKAALLELPMTPEAVSALGELLAAGPPDPAFRPDEYAAARMRAAVLERDYGAAYRAAKPHLGSILSPSSPAAVVADAGKAFLYAELAAEGLPLFAELESRAAAEAARAQDALAAAPTRRTAWYALFYRARFAHSLEKWAEAVPLFRRAAAGAPTAADRDAALWYGLDAASKAARAEAAAAVAKAGGAKAKPAKTRAAEVRALKTELAALAEAAASWSSPERFADLADGLFREALRARDWKSLYDLSTSLAGRAGGALEARVSYAAARVLELGYYAPEELRARGPEALAWEARSRFLEIAAKADAGLHYRALAAWRSGAAPALVPSVAGAPPAPGALPEEETFLLGLAAFGMPDLAVSEARARSRAGKLERDTLRRLSAALAARGINDGSLRLAAALLERPDWDPRRSDYELLYPRPYLDEYRAIRPRPACPEQILYGLVRSESLFRADIASQAGAVGLSQLMPATAAEIARALRLGAYDLKTPRDNLRIGAAFFSELLDETDRPLRAMMAYNAGRGRLRKWKTEAGDLPDDLMLEAIGIEETRQYGRNILSASVMYGELYYGVPAAETARYAVEGGALGD